MPRPKKKKTESIITARIRKKVDGEWRSFTPEEYDKWKFDHLSESQKLLREVESLPVENLTPRVVEIARAYATRMAGNILETIPWNYKQWKFINSKSLYCMLCGPNQIGGKTTALEAIARILATNECPEGYNGIRFEAPPTIIMGSVTKEKTQEVLVDRLLGKHGDRGGPGAYLTKEYFDPREDGDIFHDRGASRGSVKTVLVQWRNKEGLRQGKSTIHFISYEKGWERSQSSTIHAVLCDEEPQDRLYRELEARTNMTRGIIRIAECPLKGYTLLYKTYKEGGEPYEFIDYGIADCDHITQEHKQFLIDRDKNNPEACARLYGQPVMGGSLMWPIADEYIMCQPFQIPQDYPKIIGMDIPHTSGRFAAALCFIDPNGHENPEDGIFYVAKVVREDRPMLSKSARSLDLLGGKRVPVAWPHDGGREDPESRGSTVAARYQNDYELNLLDEPATWEDSYGKRNTTTMPMFLEMGELMGEGRFKVFASCWQFFEEKRMFSFKDGKIMAKQQKDTIDSVTKAFMMRRYAEPDVARTSPFSQLESERFF